MADLTPREKEIWAGLRRPGSGVRSEVSDELERLRRNLDWSVYQSDTTGATVTDYAGHSTYLQNNASFTAQQADALNNKIQNNLTDTDSSGTTWDEYEDHVSSSASWEEWANLFGNHREFSGDSAGVRVFEQAGRTYNNIQAPAGSVELFGVEVFVSKHEAPSGQSQFAYANLAVSNTTPEPGVTITITADVTNNGSETGFANPVLTEDGRVVDTDNVKVASGATETVSFSRTYDDLVSVEVSVSGLPPVTVSVEPPPLN